jgi:hypothetical protein
VHIKDLMRTAVDEAFQAQVGKLFSVWFVDPGGQPERAAAGTKKLIAIYKQAMAAIEGMQ